jgi:hypothetical protein
MAGAVDEHNLPHKLGVPEWSQFPQSLQKALVALDAKWAHDDVEMAKELQSFNDAEGIMHHRANITAVLQKHIDGKAKISTGTLLMLAYLSNGGVQLGISENDSATEYKQNCVEIGKLEEELANLFH